MNVSNKSFLLCGFSWSACCLVCTVLLRITVHIKQSSLHCLNLAKSNQAYLLESNGYLVPNTENPEIKKLLPGNTTAEKISIRIRDLIFWSYHIASGMNHLGKKKVIHSDLATRNVLLAEGNIVKIAYFGLSRSTKYYNETYLKKGGEALPIRWMAIESLTGRIYTTQSDVWSFGVVLWKLFSLRQLPYPEIANFTNLVQYLWDNKRLKKPSFMPKPVADIMAKCWKNNPMERPTFSQLETELCNT